MGVKRVKPKPYIILGITIIVMIIVILIGSNFSTTGKASYTVPKSNSGVIGVSCDGFGEGTTNNPFEINNCFELQNMRLSPNANFEICSNIDCKATIGTKIDKKEPGFIPVGISQEEAFTGSLNGNGFEVTKLNSRYSGEFCGLFGYVKDAEVRNLYVKNSQFLGDCEYAGVIAGYSDNSAFTLISVTGAIENTKENSFTGGLFGLMKDSTIANSEGIMFMEGENTGGITGVADESTLFEVHTQSTIIGTNTGGLTANLINSKIQKSFSYSTIEGVSAGLVFKATNSEIINSFAMGDISGEKVAGLAYELENSKIENSYFRGSFYSNEPSGLVGVKDESSTILNSYFDSEVAKIKGEEGKTTTEMKEQTTYNNWDFETIWGINSQTHNGFPYHI